MMKRIHIYGLGLMLMVLAAACSSSGKLKKSSAVGNLSEREYMEELIALAPVGDALTAKMNLTIDLNGKGSTKVGGTLRMKRGEVIQLSVTPFLGIEVARAEISPDGVLVIDRMNKRYVQVSFGELKERLNADLDFHALQSLFLNEIFLPGHSGVLTARDASSFAVTPGEGISLVEVKRSGRFVYRFRAESSAARLKATHVGLSGTTYGVDWQYDKFRPLEQREFPSLMTVTIEGGKKSVGAQFELSRFSLSSDWETHTEVSPRYEKVELEDLLKQLMK